MEWQVLYDPEFAQWLMEQPVALQDAMLSGVVLLKTYGPTLSRPYVDTLKGARYPNMKELRVQHLGDPWRVLFIFDPKRRAVVLIGGNKRGDKRWYETHLPIAEARYQRYLSRMEQ